MSDGSQVRRRRLGESDLLSNGFDSSVSNGACKKRTFGYCETVVVWVLFFSLILLNFAFIQYRFHNFPHPKDAPSDQEALKNGEFYESLAREHLETVTNFGPRPTGSVANEVHARNYILDQLSLFKNNVNPRKKLEVDVQQVNGSFYLYFIHTHFYSVYENIANIAVKLGPVSGADHSVLMNCHYDTMVDSPGAGDDMSSCAVMLEIIRSLSSSDEKLRHNIIFLFNSAEENILQASHGFITQHPWAPSIKAFVNLDSAGAGGWEIVFQTGPQNPWLVKSYIESAPYPSASVINQEIFEMELVPGDTDFRIFRDFGKIPGVDVAYISNGYVYHTALDKAKYIPPGCLQRAGENLRALIKTLATSPKLPDPGEDKHGSMVFYDFVGLVLIHYPKAIGTIINYFSAVFAFIYLIKKWNNSTLKNGARSPKRKKSNGINGHDVAASWRCGSCSNHNSLLATLCANCSGQHQYQQNGYSNTQEKIPESVSNFDGPQYFQYIFRALISIIATWVVCCISVMLVAMILSQLGRGMFWFTHSNNFIFIFTIPAVFTAIIFHSRLKETVFKGLDSYAIEEIYFDTCLGVCVFWTFLMTYYGLAMTFVCAMATFFPLAARMLYNALPTVYKNNPRVLIGLQICGLFVPTILMCYIIFCLFELFVPIFGRVGSAVNPDLALAGFAVVVTMIFIHYLIGITYICDMKPVLHILVGVFSINVILVLFTSLGFPYRGDEHSPTAQRFLVMNINREFYHKNGSLRKTDSGLWYQPFDFHGLHFAKMYVPELDNTPYTIYEGDAPYLGAPFLLPMAHIMDVRVGKYLHLPPFQPLPPVQGQLVKQEEFISSGFKRFTFQMSGPDHMNVHIVPESGVQLKAWSISPGTPKPATLPPDAQITSYYIYYGYGTKPTTPWEFHIDLSGDVFSSEKPAVKIAFCGCYIHGDQKDTAPLKKMKDRLPDWAVMNSFSCTYSQHTY